MQQLIGFLPGNVKGVLSSSNCSFVGHITLREELFFVFLSEGGEKEPLPLSRQTFEVTEARTNGLVSLVVFRQTGFSSASIRLFI